MRNLLFSGLVLMGVGGCAAGGATPAPTDLEGVAADRPLTSADLGPDAARWWALAQAEDRRLGGPGDRALLTAALADPSPALRRSAVRAAGRREAPEWVGAIAALLEDPDPEVRIEAANALAQAVFRGDEGAVRDAERALLEALERVQAGVELELAVGGSLARAVGRLRFPPSMLAESGPRVAEALAAFGAQVEGAAGAASGGGSGAETAADREAARLGLSRGALFLLRSPGTRSMGAPRDALLALLDQ
jgi:hypothetical protein